MPEGFSIAIVGATGAVGLEILDLLPAKNLPVSMLRLLASDALAGRSLDYAGDRHPVEAADSKSFRRIDFAFFSAGSDVSLDLVPYALRDGATVIDNSSAFRMKEDVPLIVPEVNPHMLDKGGHLFANPNCTTIQLVVALSPIDHEYGLERVVVTSLQAVSGAGSEAVQELEDHTLAELEGRSFQPSVYPDGIAFNVLPSIGPLDDRGFCVEENKIVAETRKILGLPDLRITATTTRVPVIRGHGISVNLETRSKASPEDVAALLNSSPGCRVMDRFGGTGEHPTPLRSAHQDTVLVGRIREDASVPHGLHLWIVADNLRKGAATNALQIAEALFQRRGLPE